MKFLILLSTLFAQYSMSCSCAGFSEPYLAGAREGAIVAKVKTIKSVKSKYSLDATVEILDLMKGDLSGKKEIYIVGPDGMSCNGRINTTGNSEWVTIIRPINPRYNRIDVEGYAVVGCARSYVEIDPETNMLKKVFQETDLSMEKFTELVNKRIQPTIDKVLCTKSVFHKVSDAKTYKKIEEQSFNKSFKEPENFLLPKVSGTSEIKYELEINHLDKKYHYSFEVENVWINSYSFNSLVTYNNPLSGQTETVNEKISLFEEANFDLVKWGYVNNEQLGVNVHDYMGLHCNFHLRKPFILVN
jgi:hypothetical protein